jgi:hypothetical protein
MATERVTFDFPGALAAGQISQQVRATYNRILTYVRMSTLGANPSGAAVVVQLRLAEVEQAATYSLAAGLKSAENTAASVSCPANTWTDFIIDSVSTAYDLKVEAEFSVAVNVLGGSTTDLGLGTLGQLKRYLLAPGIVAETTYDEAITFIGKGVAVQFDRYCNRTFQRGSSITEDFRGGTDMLTLGRYPTESIASIGLKTVGETSFTTQTSVTDTLALDSGVLLLTGDLGTKRDQLRVTYTGGYWYDTTDDDTGTQPSGSTLLPHDIKHAWLQQCQHVWSKRQDLGLDHVISDPVQRTTFNEMDFTPMVKGALEPYRRLMMTP